MHRGVISVAPDAGLTTVAATMAAHAVHAAVLLGPRRNGAFVVTDLDVIRAALGGRFEATAVEVAREPLLAVAADERLERAVALMATRDVSHLLVSDPDGEWPAGVLSSLDVMAVLSGRDPRMRIARQGPARPPVSASDLAATTVAAVMHPGVVTCLPDNRLEPVAGTMADLRIHCVAVMGAGDGHFVWGLVTDMDVLHAAYRGAPVTAGEIAASSPLAVSADSRAGPRGRADGRPRDGARRGGRPRRAPHGRRLDAGCAADRGGQLSRAQRSRASRMCRPSDAIAGSPVRNSRASPCRYSSSCEGRLADRLVHGDALVGLLGGGGRDAVLGQPAREVLAGDLALRPPQRSALGVTTGSEATGAATGEQATCDDRLAGIGGVGDAGGARDGGRRAARLMGGEAAELQGRHDGVAGRPDAPAPLHAAVVARDDEPLLVVRQAVERGADQPRDGVDALNLAAARRRARAPARLRRGVRRRPS